MSRPKIFDLIKRIKNLEEANILKACLTSDNTTLTSEGNYSRKEIPLSQTLKIGTKLSFSNNGIVIGEDVNHIKISTKVIATSPTKSTLCGLNIMKNGQDISCCYDNTGATWSFNTFSNTKETFEVQPGDVIKLCYYFNSVGDEVTLRQYGESTFLEVEVVD